ncbi:hypothetical protein KIPB_013319, partial [Kipferlia bialata]
LLEGLAELHRHNVAHRDIKPENIMMCLTPGSSVPCCKLIDLGLCRSFKEAEELLPSFELERVSPLYSAPEKFKDLSDGTGYGLGIDVWALGLTLSKAPDR